VIDPISLKHSKNKAVKERFATIIHRREEEGQSHKHFRLIDLSPNKVVDPLEVTPNINSNQQYVQVSHLASQEASMFRISSRQ